MCKQLFALFAALIGKGLVLQGGKVDEHVQPCALHGGLERERGDAKIADNVRVRRADKLGTEVDGLGADLHHRQRHLRAAAEACLHGAAANGLVRVVVLREGERFDQNVEDLAVAVHDVDKALLELIALGNGVQKALAVVLKALLVQRQAVDHHRQRDADTAGKTGHSAAAGSGSA